MATGGQIPHSCSNGKKEEVIKSGERLLNHYANDFINNIKVSLVNKKMSVLFLIVCQIIGQEGKLVKG